MRTGRAFYYRRRRICDGLPELLEHARKIATQWRVEEREAPAAAGHVIPMSRLAELYMERYSKPKKKSSWQDEKRWARISEAFPEFMARPVASVTAWHVESIHHGLRETPYEANRVLALISSAMNKAIKWGFREGLNPCLGVERFQERPRSRVLSSAELSRLGMALGRLPQAERLYLQVLVTTGCRPGEPLSWEVDWIDEEASLVRQRDAKGDRSLALGRTVHLPRGLAAELLSLERPPGCRLVWHGMSGKNAWSRACRIAGIKDAPRYTLRHTFRTLAPDVGIPAEYAADLLGQRTERVTESYRHSPTSVQAIAAGRMAEELQRRIGA